MPSTVVVKMNTCSKTHRITVSLRDDGNLDVDIQSDCKHIQDYASKLKVISIEDASSFAGSKIVDPEISKPVSAPCLCPNGVFNAAWKELGMLTRTLCARVHGNEVVLDPDDRRRHYSPPSASC